MNTGSSRLVSRLFLTATAFLAALSIPAVARPVYAGEVAVFVDEDYVDMDSDPVRYAEGRMMVEVVGLLGHPVHEVRGVTAAELADGLAGQSVLVIPADEVAPLAASLDTPALQVLRDFVENGGGLVVASSERDSRTSDLLNEVFGWSTTLLRGGWGGGRTTAAVGTAFEGGPDFLYPVRIGLSSLPAGHKVMYSGPDRNAVVLVDQGGGRVVFLGWNWSVGSYGADPLDADWNEVLDAALDEAAGCSEAGAPDGDDDGHPDVCDNCPAIANAAQQDADEDGSGDACDNCPVERNVDQGDIDGDTVGDACDPDRDGDGHANGPDNCPDLADVSLADGDADGVGDVCDTCVSTFNPPDKLDLDATLANLLQGDGDVAALVPNRFDFEEGDATYPSTSYSRIWDGGSDMYDDGNRLVTNLAGTVSYSNRESRPGGALFGAGSRYVTLKQQGMFSLLVDDPALQSFGIVGNTGHDGVGAVSGARLATFVGAAPFTVFVKRTFGAGNPSINHLILVPGDGTGITHTFPASTDDDADTLSGLGGVDQLFYLLVSRANGQALSDGDALAVAEAFLAHAALSQRDSDGDGSGDACEADDDADGVADVADNCPRRPNADQADPDGDGDGDPCDHDDDADGLEDAIDNCPAVVNVEQDDTDEDGVGDACNDADDPDGDERADALDNCPAVANPHQEDYDRDGVGNACNDADDTDGDEWADALDDCPLAPGWPSDRDADGTGDGCDVCLYQHDPAQTDTDGDGQGDQCDVDPDGDGLVTGADLCPLVADPGQPDADGDGVGDACDVCATDPDSAGVRDLAAMVDAMRGAYAAVTAELAASVEEDFFGGDRPCASSGGRYDCVSDSFSTEKRGEADYTGGAVVSGDAAFGEGSRYATMRHPGILAYAIDGSSFDRLDDDGWLGDREPITEEVVVSGQLYRYHASAWSNEAFAHHHMTIVEGPHGRWEKGVVVGLTGGRRVYHLYLRTAPPFSSPVQLRAAAEAFLRMIVHGGQKDTDGDGHGDACDSDDDGDGVVDASDVCALAPDALQEDGDGDGAGDVCDVCDGADDAADADADGAADGCDACVAVGQPEFSRVVVKLKGNVDDFSTHDWGYYGGARDSLAVKGEFALAVGASFADIDPLASPVRLDIAQNAGLSRLSIELPTTLYEGAGTSGWVAGPTGSSWVFVSSPSADLGGITRCSLTSKSGGRVAVGVRASTTAFNAVFPIRSWDVPLRVSVAYGDPQVGLCAQASFSEADCVAATGRSGRKARCSR